MFIVLKPKHVAHCHIRNDIIPNVFWRFSPFFFLSMIHYRVPWWYYLSFQFLPLVAHTSQLRKMASLL